jgi:hypothetical protein
MNEQAVTHWQRSAEVIRMKLAVGDSSRSLKPYEKSPIVVPV